jgi:hypothetical protein
VRVRPGTCRCASPAPSRRSGARSSRWASPDSEAGRGPTSGRTSGTGSSPRSHPARPPG